MTRTPKQALSKVAGAVKRTATKVTARLHRDKKSAAPAEAPSLPRMATKKPAAKPAASAPRRKRAEPDVPVNEKAYTPHQTSLKAGFRASGADRQRDQDAVSDDRFKDEDRLTNKSGDPRIGTHGRTYEPGE